MRLINTEYDETKIINYLVSPNGVDAVFSRMLLVDFLFLRRRTATFGLLTLKPNLELLFPWFRYRAVVVIEITPVPGRTPGVVSARKGRLYAWPISASSSGDRRKSPREKSNRIARVMKVYKG